jgi:hypothetical protein
MIFNLKQQVIAFFKDAVINNIYLFIIHLNIFVDLFFGKNRNQSK